MGVTIKNPVAEQLIAELAALTGETKTEALTKATRERLERVQRASRRERVVAAATALQVAMANEEPLSTNHLYDEQGLPR